MALGIYLMKLIFKQSCKHQNCVGLFKAIGIVRWSTFDLFNGLLIECENAFFSRVLTSK